MAVIGQSHLLWRNRVTDHISHAIAQILSEKCATPLETATSLFFCRTVNL